MRLSFLEEKEFVCRFEQFLVPYWSQLEWQTIPEYSWLISEGIFIHFTFRLRYLNNSIWWGSCVNVMCFRRINDFVHKMNRSVLINTPVHFVSHIVVSPRFNRLPPELTDKISSTNIYIFRSVFYYKTYKMIRDGNSMLKISCNAYRIPELLRW